MLDGANTSALVLAPAVDSFSHSELRWEFANLAAALALLSLAFAAFALFFFRRATLRLWADCRLLAKTEIAAAGVGANPGLARER